MRILKADREVPEPMGLRTDPKAVTETERRKPVVLADGENFQSDGLIPRAL